MGPIASIVLMLTLVLSGVGLLVLGIWSGNDVLWLGGMIMLIGFVLWMKLDIIEMKMDHYRNERN